MKIKILLSLYLILNCLYLNSQPEFETGEYKDQRDGKIYSTIKIYNTVWFAENLKYRTAKSDSITKKDFGVDLDGYYYLYEEATKVCPVGTGLPTLDQWEAYVNRLIELKSIPKTSIYYIKSVENDTLKYSHWSLEDDYQFINDPNPLNIQDSKYMYGTIMETRNDGIDFWLKSDEPNENKPHVRFYDNQIWNIINTEHRPSDEKRKFVVRCVKLPSNIKQ